jgi:RNase P/RNase MRP subunit POP5
LPRLGPRRPSAALFRAALDEALLALHGAVGGAVALRVLRFEGSSGEGVVALDARDAHKLWPAAALLTQLRGEQCTLQVRAQKKKRRCAMRR